MREFLSYLWWRITRRGPGLPVNEPIPYTPTASGILEYGNLMDLTVRANRSFAIRYGRGSEFISG